MRKTLPINLQFFAEGGDGNGDQNAGSNNNGQAGQQGGQNNQQAAGIDYDKIQSMLDTATARKENAVLKSYFQQQGLSEEEVSQAIATFKQNKQQQVEQQQNANANLQNEVTTAQKDAEQARIELAATQVAMTLACIVAIWLICNEIISILENINDIGVTLPPFLQPIVSNLKSQVEKKAELENIKDKNESEE